MPFFRGAFFPLSTNYNVVWYILYYCAIFKFMFMFISNHVQCQSKLKIDIEIPPPLIMIPQEDTVFSGRKIVICPPGTNPQCQSRWGLVQLKWTLKSIPLWFQRRVLYFLNVKSYSALLELKYQNPLQCQSGRVQLRLTLKFLPLRYGINKTQ